MERLTSSLQSCYLNLEREQALFKVVSKIRESLDLEEILQTTIQEIRQLLAVDRVGILRLHPATGWDEGEFIAESVLPRFNSVLAERVRDHCFGEQYAAAYRNGRIQAVADIHDAGLSDCHRKILSRFQVRANLLVPLLHGDKLWGLLCLHQCSGPRQWLPDEIEFVAKIATHLGVAIQHSELLCKTQKQALELNQALHNLRSAHVQLAQVEKMASLGQLAAGVAHEINNPVTFIQGNLQYVDHHVKALVKLVTLYQENCSLNVPAIQSMVEELDVEFLLEDLAKILNSMTVGSARISNIVDSLRNFSGLDQPSLKAIDLNENIENTLLMLKNRLQATQYRPKIKLQKSYRQLPKIECYPGQINQVVWSILTNAIDAFDEAWTNAPMPHLPTIHIGTEALAEAVTIVIKDNGPGMTDRVKAKLYDPFFTTKPVGQGTGLGLAISHQIIAKHRGILQCSSEVGQGAEFSIKLPIKQNPVPLGNG
ncbi:MAG: GAF domain-containing protein [Cyanobacteria bacterium P01_F01_bin.86]